MLYINWFGAFTGAPLGVLEERKDKVGTRFLHLEKDSGKKKFLGVDGSLNFQFGVKVYYGNGVGKPKTILCPIEVTISTITDSEFINTRHYTNNM